MNQKARTKDERFLLCLHALAQKAGNPFTEIDRYVVGNALGLHTKAVDTICRLLMQTNFIRKRGDIAVEMTPQGIRLVEQLLSET